MGFRWSYKSLPAGIFSPTLLTMTTNVFLALVGLATGALAARLLGPSGRGELAAIQMYAIAFGQIALVGMPDAVIYYTARNPANARTHVSVAVVTSMLCAIPILVVLYFLMPTLLSGQPDHVVAAARWFLLLIVIQIPLYMLGEPLRGQKAFLAWNLLRVTPALGWLCILLVAKPLGKTDPVWFAGAYLVIWVLLIIPRFLVFMRKTNGTFSLSAGLAKGMITYGLPQTLSSVPQTLTMRLDQMLMAAFLAPYSLGLYAAAVSWSNAANPLLRAIGFVLFPRVASETNQQAQNQLLAHGVRRGALLGIGIGLPLVLVTPFVIPTLFGPRFSEAIPAAVILMVAGVVHGVKGVMQDAIRGIGQTKIILWGEITGLMVTILTLALLLRPYGIVGAATASLISYTAVAGLFVLLLSAQTGIRPRMLCLPTVDDLKRTWATARSTIDMLRMARL